MSAIDDPLLEVLKLDRPYRIADIGCGGGGTSLEILRRAPAGSSVHGFDISPALVDLARSRKPSPEAAISFEVQDVATAPPPAQPFERLVSRFGTMFYDDPPAAFTNLSRWLAPDGRFTFAVWAAAEDNPYFTLLIQAISQAVEIPEMDPDGPGPLRYQEVSKLVDLLNQSGFAQIETQTWRGPMLVGGGTNAAQAARFALTSTSLGDLLTEAGEEAKTLAYRSLEDSYRPFERDGVVILEACIHLVSGTRAD